MNTLEENRLGLEEVHTIQDYWDQPREGVADYNGLPHYYKCIFDEEKDEWSNTYILKPLDAETLLLLEESQEIFQRWADAYRKGETTLDSHPAHAEDRERLTELRNILAHRLTTDAAEDIRADGRFEVAEGMSVAPSQAKWRVRWIVRTKPKNIQPTSKLAYQ